MKRFRLILLTVAAAGLTVAAVASAGQAKQGLAVTHARATARGFDAYTKFIELAVQQSSYKPGAAANPGFVFLSDPDDAATAKMTIFSPPGYTNSLTQAPGATVGKAYALVKAGQLGGAILPLSGPVVVGDPSDPTLKAAYAQCKNPQLDPPSPQEVVVLNTSLQGQTIQVPDFLNTVTIGSNTYVTQEVCLPPPATATFQAQVVLANFTIKGIWTNGAAGTHEWVGDFTPYNGTVPDAASTVERRTLVGLPSSLTFKRVKSKPSLVKFAGKLSIRGVNPLGLRLHVFFGPKSQPAPSFVKPSGKCITTNCKVFLTGALKANGTYSKTRKKVAKRTYFQAFLSDGWSLRAGCQTPSPTGLPLPCQKFLSPMITGQVAVSPPRKKHR